MVIPWKKEGYRHWAGMGAEEEIGVQSTSNRHILYESVTSVNGNAQVFWVGQGGS